ncbi:MAG: bifunctional molybdenum cofactor biosynthesis protein MoaC/MoaB [Bacteroidetes bacterium]|nr:bifunctional molybdenum cofactor biosynthesis protein MoaC/MoaB [Bacteroidota bacterium]
MQDITHKISTLRLAVASATVSVSKQETIDAINSKQVAKGDVFEMAKAAGLLAVKKTSDVIPDCHPMPIEGAKFSFEVEKLNIKIYLEVKTIYKTGVEVEAMHGASVAALTMYDMLKPIDKGVEISSIKLIEKRGGKSDFTDKYKTDLSAAVIVCSDSVSSGKKADKAGKAIIAKLEKHHVNNIAYDIIADDPKLIEERFNHYVESKTDLILFCGGTGLSLRDVTPETIKPLLDREIVSLMETARMYGQQRTPYAMLSRGVAGMKNRTLVLTLPGSTRGAEETMDALFPYVLHIFRVVNDKGHE